jgi:hypothetical protein
VPGADRALASIAIETSTPITVGACSASATVDIPVPHATSSARRSGTEPAIARMRASERG